MFFYFFFTKAIIFTIFAVNKAETFKKESRNTRKSLKNSTTQWQ